MKTYSKRHLRRLASAFFKERPHSTAHVHGGPSTSTVAEEDRPVTSPTVEECLPAPLQLE